MLQWYVGPTGLNTNWYRIPNNAECLLECFQTPTQFFFLCLFLLCCNSVFHGFKSQFNRYYTIHFCFQKCRFIKTYQEFLFSFSETPFQ